MNWADLKEHMYESKVALIQSVRMRLFTPRATKYRTNNSGVLNIPSESISRDRTKQQILDNYQVLTTAAVLTACPKKSTRHTLSLIHI